MGYTTEFQGKLKFNKTVNKELISYINLFSGTRRMARDNDKIKKLFPDYKKYCFNSELGKEGEYFVGGNGFFGDEFDESILDYNEPPKTQPGLWCEWIITDDGRYLEWNGNEKFYYYIEWLGYLIKNFFKPSGFYLNGTIHYRGEDFDDFGTIIVENNVIDVVKRSFC